METLCGADCKKCTYGKTMNCKGCLETDGCPFDKECMIAKYIKIGGMSHYLAFKKQLIEEFNSLNIPGMPRITELYPLNGGYINLAYPLPNGEMVKFLDDDRIYLGNQVESEFDSKEFNRCYGLVAGMGFLLVCEYGENGTNPDIILYKKR